MDQNERQAQLKQQRAHGFISELGQAMHAPDLSLGQDGVCGFKLSSGSIVVFLHYEQLSFLVCQLTPAMPDDIDYSKCYLEALQRSYYANPGQDGSICVPSGGDGLMVYWRLLINGSIPHAEIFSQYLLQADSYWTHFLEGQRRS